MEANCLDMSNVISVVKKALIDFQEGKILFRIKFLKFLMKKLKTELIACLQHYLRKNLWRKWVSVFPRNPVLYNIPNVSGTIILSEIVSGQPITFMDGSICTLMRTAAISCIGAEYFAKENSETIGIIGAGEQGRMHLIAMKTVRPSLKVCKVASNTIESEKQFEKDMKGIFDDLEIIRCNTNLMEAAEGSDIIVTATSTQAPLLKADWVGKGAFYAHVGGWEDEFAVAKKADRIICDDWEAVKHRTQTLSRMYKAGELSDDDIYADLHELVVGKKSGRLNDDEFIYFNSVGLSYVDVALSYVFYKQATECGKGTAIDFQGLSIWDAFKK